jgi:AsmA protein
MRKRSKLIVCAIGGIAGLIAIVIIALLLIVDVNAYRPQLETAAARALGHEVRITGALGFDLFPGLQLTLEDVQIGASGAEIATAREVRLGLALLPLLRKHVRVETLVIQQPSILVIRGGDGSFNFDRDEDHSSPVTEAQHSALELSEVAVAEGTLNYLDEQSGEGFVARDCSLKIAPLRIARGDSTGLMRDLSFTAELTCGEIRGNNLAVADVKVSATGQQGVIDLQPVTFKVFGGQGSGSIHADFTSTVPHYRVRYALPQFQIAEFFKSFSPQKIAEGQMSFSANLSMQGKTFSELRQTLAGQVSLRGGNLTIHGHDLDDELSRFTSSQNFNLVDVGAFFFAGPFGMVISKAYNFARLAQGPGGSSTIRMLVSEWDIAQGIARAQDVAMATDKNRVALQGELDLINEQFNHLTVALLTPEGCVKVRQTVRGSFQHPVVESPSTIKVLSGPFLKLYNMGRALFPGGECDVFYAGSILPPTD